MSKISGHEQMQKVKLFQNLQTMTKIWTKRTYYHRWSLVNLENYTTIFPVQFEIRAKIVHKFWKVIFFQEIAEKVIKNTKTRRNNRLTDHINFKSLLSNSPKFFKKFPNLSASIVLSGTNLVLVLLKYTLKIWKKFVKNWLAWF